MTTDKKFRPGAPAGPVLLCRALCHRPLPGDLRLDTTLAAILDRINRSECKHILTPEDPIEYVYTPDKCVINQRESGRDTRSFAAGLRAALREDPDAILVGEMRDLETIEMALTAAETGHLVFGTVHTNSAADSIDRIGDVSNGWSMSYSLEQRARSKLPVTFRETVRAGEESGDLYAAFARLSDYFDRMAKTRQSVSGALTYPAFVTVVAIVMGYAVPTFVRMFGNTDVEPPWNTRALIAVSGFFQKYALVLLGVIALGILALRACAATAKGGLVLSRVLLKLPVLGRIVRMSGASQFAHTMSAPLAAGMPILQAIEVSGRTMTNKRAAAEAGA